MSDWPSRTAIPHALVERGDKVAELGFADLVCGLRAGGQLHLQRLGERARGGGGPLGGGGGGGCAVGVEVAVVEGVVGSVSTESSRCPLVWPSHALFPRRPFAAARAVFCAVLRPVGVYPGP